MQIRSRSTYEVRIYLGSVNEETKKAFSKDDLIREVGLYQESQPQKIPLRITETVFVCETHYEETGWELAAINYPRIETGSKNIDDFMIKLASYLLDVFGQRRISIVMPLETLMLERYDEGKRFKWGREKLETIVPHSKKQR